MSELIVAPETAMTDGDTDQFVLMRVGTQDIAFAIQDVRDAVEPDAITPIPLAPSAIAGVMNVRGRIVTVVDLRRILGGEAGDDEAARDYSHMTGITVDRPEGPFSLLVDSVSEVQRIARSLLEPPPVTLDPALKRLCTGVFQLPDRLVVLLDVDRILEPATIRATPTLPFRPRRKMPMVEDHGAQRAPAIELRDAALEPHEVRCAPGGAVDDVRSPPRVAAVASTGGREEKQTEFLPAPTELPKRVAAAPAPRVEVPILDGIGGEAALSALVGAVYEEILADPLLAEFYADADMSVQRGRMIAALARLLATAGSNFGATEIGYDWLVPKKVMEDEHFNLCLAHFERVLDRLGTETSLGERFLTAIEWCREGVVD
jgi:purine-binding chemotaxis protein CheW